MTERKSERYNFNDYNRADFNLDEVKIEIDLEKSIEAKLLDISLKGIGFIVSGLNQKIIDEIEASNSFYLKLFFGADFILLGVKKIWNLIKNIDDKDVMQVGVEIETISPEDNLKLSALIDKIRSAASK